MARLAMAQMRSGNDLEVNLNRMRAYVKEAAGRGAELVVFPEMAYFSGKAEEWASLLPRYEPLLETFGGWAREFLIQIIPGTLREPSKGEPGRYFNTMPLLHPKDGMASKYRKIFLFKANLPDRAYDESAHCDAGKLVNIFNNPTYELGFAICFDLRFPELFRTLKARGAQIVVVPSSFTVPTGEAHWEALLRARAIENQMFIVAPAQVGTLGNGDKAYGRSLVVSPWGEIKLDLGPTEEGLGVFDLSLDEITAAAAKVASWDCRRSDLFPFR